MSFVIVWYSRELVLCCEPQAYFGYVVVTKEAERVPSMEGVRGNADQLRCTAGIVEDPKSGILPCCGDAIAVFGSKSAYIVFRSLMLNNHLHNVNASLASLP